MGKIYLSTGRRPRKPDRKERAEVGRQREKLQTSFKASLLISVAYLRVADWEVHIDVLVKCNKNSFKMNR